MIRTDTTGGRGSAATTTRMDAGQRNGSNTQFVTQTTDFVFVRTELKSKFTALGGHEMHQKKKSFQINRPSNGEQRFVMKVEMGAWPPLSGAPF